MFGLKYRSMSIDGRWVSSVDGGERVPVDGTSTWVDSGWRKSSDEQVLLSIDQECASLRIERSKFAWFGENSSWVSLLLLVLLGMYLKIQEKFLCQQSFLNLIKIKSNRRSKLPSNCTKFDMTQITLRSEFTLSNKKFNCSTAVFYVVGQAVCGFDSLPFTGRCVARTLFIKRFQECFC